MNVLEAISNSKVLSGIVEKVCVSRCLAAMDDSFHAVEISPRLATWSISLSVCTEKQMMTLIKRWCHCNQHQLRIVCFSFADCDVHGRCGKEKEGGRGRRAKADFYINLGTAPMHVGTMTGRVTLEEHMQFHCGLQQHLDREICVSPCQPAWMIPSIRPTSSDSRLFDLVEPQHRRQMMTLIRRWCHCNQHLVSSFAPGIPRCACFSSCKQIS